MTRCVCVLLVSTSHFIMHGHITYIHIHIHTCTGGFYWCKKDTCIHAHMHKCIHAHEALIWVLALHNTYIHAYTYTCIHAQEALIRA